MPYNRHRVIYFVVKTMYLLVGNIIPLFEFWKPPRLMMCFMEYENWDLEHFEGSESCGVNVLMSS